MVVDIAARGFSAFDNFMPDHHSDIDLDAHHYQARTRHNKGTIRASRLLYLIWGVCPEGVTSDISVFW